MTIIFTKVNFIEQQGYISTLELTLKIITRGIYLKLFNDNIEDNLWSLFPDIVATRNQRYDYSFREL
ncbi:MAG TPA: hypothetical protein G4N95_06025 [Anaerolineae bacterium]|nr:hypothetical protein [Anaerolineae bacterium]